VNRRKESSLKEDFIQMLSTRCDIGGRQTEVDNNNSGERNRKRSDDYKAHTVRLFVLIVITLS